MGIFHWILKHLQLDENDAIDVRFAVRSMCTWSVAMTLIGAIFYALIALWEMCIFLSVLLICSIAFYFYCRINARHAFTLTYWFLNLASVLIHAFTTYYLGNCGTVFFIVTALLAPHIYPLLDRRGIIFLDAVLVISVNLIFWLSLAFEPVYADAVRIPFRIVLSNFGMATFIYMLYQNVATQDFVEAARQKRIDEASQKVFSDALTGLGNRRLLERHRAELEQTVSNEYPLCVVILDIDFFKKINDTYGHIAGDKVLESVARKMQEFFRKGDLLIRWGGEEFMIFLRRTGIKDAAVLMENFRRAIQDKPINFNNTLIEAHVTIGVKEHTPNTPLEDTIKRADELMYQGKMKSRNCVMSEGKST